MVTGATDATPQMKEMKIELPGDKNEEE